MPAILQPRKMIIEEGGPLVKNQDWFDSNPDGRTREIVSELCGVGRTAVGKYIKEHREGGGILRSAMPRGPVKKAPREVATKSKMSEGETLYEAIVCRISAVHRGGRVNTARNFPRYLPVGENWPKLRGVSVRVFRRKLRLMELFFEKTKKALTAERSNPYISRRVVSYCKRRVATMKGGLPSRPRVRMDATFVNKWSTGSRSWIARDTAGGNEIQDANKGGKGIDLRFCARSQTTWAKTERTWPPLPPGR